MMIGATRFVCTIDIVFADSTSASDTHCSVWQATPCDDPMWHVSSRSGEASC